MNTPDGTVLLDPSHREKLVGLTAGQLQALNALSNGPATVAEICPPGHRSDINALMRRLHAGGWLTITVRDGERDSYSILPFTQPASPPAPPLTTRPAIMSKFAVLHRDSNGLILEHPMGWCDLRIHDGGLLALLDGTTENGVEARSTVQSRFLLDLHRCGFVVPVGDEDCTFDALSWSAPDLWFHRRSTLGKRTVTWEHFGPTKWAKGRFPQPPARRQLYPGAPIPLYVPDLRARRRHDPTLTAVLEDRVSTRAFDETRPITAEQLAELLYRTARTRSTHQVSDGDELVSRPYPSGGPSLPTWVEAPAP